MDRASAHGAMGPGGIRRAGLRTGEGVLLFVALVLVVLMLTTGRASASQRTFDSPELAVAALVDAAQRQDAGALVQVLGPVREWIFSGDKAADRARAAKFVAVYQSKHSIVRDGDVATLLIGEDDYPFAFPIVRRGVTWAFDAEAGREQLLARRIGENELSAIQTLRAIVDAQREYASADRRGDGVAQYATKFESSPGKHDGLYWPTKEGEAQSPLGPLVVRAVKEGYAKSKEGPTPFHGYYFRLLKGQGKPGTPGAFDYVVRGRAIGGFAVLAYPAKYGNTGIMSFLVNHDGKVYQADLGRDTPNTAASIQRYVIDKRWSEAATP